MLHRCTHTHIHRLVSVWCVTYSWLYVCSQIAMCSTLVPGRCWNLWFWFKRQLYPLPWVLSLSLFLFMLLFYLNNVLLSFTWILAMIASASSLGINCSKISRRKTISICKPSPSQFQPKWTAVGPPPPPPPQWLWNPKPAEPRNWGGQSWSHLQWRTYQFLMPCRLYHPEMRLKPNIWDPNEV